MFWCLNHTAINYAQPSVFQQWHLLLYFTDTISGHMTNSWFPCHGVCPFPQPPPSQSTSPYSSSHPVAGSLHDGPQQFSAPGIHACGALIGLAWVTNGMWQKWCNLTYKVYYKRYCGFYFIFSWSLGSPGWGWGELAAMSWGHKSSLMKVRPPDESQLQFANMWMSHPWRQTR